MGSGSPRIRSSGCSRRNWAAGPCWTLAYTRSRLQAWCLASRRGSRNRAAIYGTAARLEIDGWFYTPTAFRVIARDGAELERFEQPYEGRGLRGEAAEVGRCLRAGLLESPLLPLDETYTIMQAMDEVRRQIGFAYPPACSRPRPRGRA